jgi:hypothetical protein
MTFGAKLRSFLSCALLASSVACGGGTPDAVTARAAAEVTAEQIDADPVALLPSSALAVANVDARAFYQSETLGPTVGKLTERLLPIGEEAGFRPSRDVDRILAASYSMQGLDAVAVVSGRFDEKKIQELARKNTPTKGGGMVVESTYAGRSLYTINNVGIAVLTSKTALTGTETGIRRALDRIKEGRVKRAVPDWMLATLDTKGAAASLAADLAAQDLANITAGALQIRWLKGLQKVRVIANFQEPGMHVAGSLTYDTGENADVGAKGIQDASSLASMLAVTGLVPRLQGLDVKVNSTSVEYKFAVDDQALRGLLASVDKYAR